MLVTCIANTKMSFQMNIKEAKGSLQNEKSMRDCKVKGSLYILTRSVPLQVFGLLL